MIIELVGLPGAGKSTIASLLLKSIDKNDAKVVFFQDERRDTSRRKIKLPLFLLLNLLALSKLALHITRNIKLNELKLNLPRLKKLVILLFDLSEVNKKHSGSVVLMDQGIVQMLASFPAFQKMDATHHVVSIYESIKHDFRLTDCFLVLTKTDLRTAIERMQTRSKLLCDFKRLTQEELETIYNNYLSVFALFDFDFTVNSSAALDVNVAALREWINDL